MKLHWNLHGIHISGHSNDEALRERWEASFASCPWGNDPADVVVRLDVVADVPAAPSFEPQYRQGELLAYYLQGDDVTAHFPRYGRLQFDLQKGTTWGQVVRAAIEQYGVLEDLIAIALSPHLRRRGLFLIHAFAAVFADQAVLLVGDIGAGKTTTGMALLDGGWKLLSNDSPLVNEEGRVLQYPGLLAAYPATFAHFEETAHLARGAARQKNTVAAETIWPGVWQKEAPIAAILFPQIDANQGHAVERLSAPETLRRLLPHAVEQWDREMIPRHLAALRCLVEAAPGYVLYLGPEVPEIVPFLSEALKI